MSMSAGQLAVVGIRLLAVYMALQGIVVLSHNSSVFVVENPYAGEMPRYYNALVSAIVLGPTLSGLILWFVAKPLAGWMVPEGGAIGIKVGASVQEWATILISIAGLIIVVLELPYLIQLLVALYSSSEVVSDLAGERRIFKEGMLLKVAASNLKILLGLLLLTTARFWARLVYQIRNFGLEAKP